MFSLNYIFGILIGTWLFMYKNIGSSCYGHPSDHSYFCGRIRKRNIECICFFAIVIFTFLNYGMSMSCILFWLLGLLTAYPYHFFAMKFYHTHNRCIILGMEIFDCFVFDGYFIYKILTIWITPTDIASLISGVSDLENTIQYWKFLKLNITLCNTPLSVCEITLSMKVIHFWLPIHKATTVCYNCYFYKLTLIVVSYK